MANKLRVKRSQMEARAPRTIEEFAKHLARMKQRQDEQLADLARQIQQIQRGPQGAQGVQGIAGPPGSGGGGGGKLVNRSYTETLAHITTVHDESLTAAPTITKGTSVLTLVYTAADAANTVRVSARLNGSMPGTGNMIGTLWDQTGSTILDAADTTVPLNYFNQLSLAGEFVIGDTAAHTFELRCSGDSINAVNVELNWASFAGSQTNGGNTRAWLMVEEFEP